MGRKRHRHRRPLPRPPEGTSAVGFADWLGHSGEILVLCETPSGFALFNYDGVQLFLPNAIEDVWAYFAWDYMAKDVVMLREFQTFEDKARAIKLKTGVSDQLARMIKKWLLPGQKLAVGKHEYKTTIEASLGISCLCDDAVMELMWGLKNLMKTLVPGENLELTKEDCLPVSKGMMIVLKRHGIDVKPEMVNRQIVEMAQGLYECDWCVNKHVGSLQDALKEVSDINFKDWDPLKLASALKIICYPNEKCKYEMFSDDELPKLQALARSSEGKFFENTCLAIYNEIVWAYGFRDKVERRLRFLVEEARKSNTAEVGVDLPEKMSTSTYVDKREGV
ncbi:unnamed protein product [Urochloa decumbens]|uniref:Uncharacterized protein n=2 Tax=Urochloa decumbens TaxID=240449 RepID=A0ABC8YKA5_9POAL